MASHPSVESVHSRNTRTCDPTTGAVFPSWMGAAVTDIIECGNSVCCLQLSKIITSLPLSNWCWCSGSWSPPGPGLCAAHMAIVSVTFLEDEGIDVPQV